MGTQVSDKHYSLKQVKFDRVLKSDAGLYECVASNKAGTRTISVFINLSNEKGLD